MYSTRPSVGWSVGEPGRTAMMEWTFTTGAVGNSERPVRIGDPHFNSSMLVGMVLRKWSRKNAGSLRDTSRWWAARNGSATRTSRVPRC